MSVFYFINGDDDGPEIFAAVACFLFCLATMGVIL